jgi:hypothetical protein
MMLQETVIAISGLNCERFLLLFCTYIWASLVTPPLLAALIGETSKKYSH